MDIHTEYWKLCGVEERFNTTQSTVRALASTWLLAAFGAIAVLVRTDESVTWLFPTPVLVVLVVTMASVGLFTLWIVDQIVYQRLLNAVALMGLKMEHDNPELPPMRALMMDSAEGIGMARWLRMFYVIPMITFLLITVAMSLLLETPSGDVAETVTPLIKHPWLLMAILAMTQVASLIVIFVKGQDIYLTKRPGLFHDEEFTALFSDEKYRAEDVIRKYIPSGKQKPDNKAEHGSSGGGS